MDYKSAIREVQKGNTSPIYLCYGPEKFLANQFIDAIVDKLIGSEGKDMAITRYDLAETPLETVIEEAETLPFLVPYKIVIANNALLFTGAKESNKVEHNVDRLIQYMKSPVDYSVIIFTVDAEKLDERKKIVKAFKESNYNVPFLPLSPEDLVQWTKRRASKQSINMTDAAADQLILYTGGNLHTLAAELEKCFLFLGEGGELTTEVVDELVTRSTEQNVFILIEDIVQGNLPRAFTIFHELLKQKEEPIKILILIARQFRIILQVKELTSQSYSQGQIASQLGLHPYAVKIAAGQGNRYKMDDLYRIMGQLADLDYGMKTGQKDKVMGLELFLLGLHKAV